MEKKIAFDLDGVLRDLYTQYSERTGDVSGVWNCPIAKFYDENLPLLNECEPTKDAFFVAQSLIASGRKVEVWHHARPYWKSYAYRWVSNHLPGAILLFLNPDQKIVRMRNKGYILFDDNPEISMHSGVVCVDRPWNRDVEAAKRVKTRFEMMRECVSVDKKK